MGFSSIFSRRDATQPVGKTRNKEFEIQCPRSCVKKVSAPAQLSLTLSPLPFFAWNERQTKPQKQLLGRCVSVKERLLLPQPPSSSTPCVSSLDRTLSFSLLFLFLLFPPLSFSLHLSKNKALLMTVGSQGPAGARVLKSTAHWKRGAPPPPLPPLLSQVKIEGQEGLMCCCCREVWAITMAANVVNTKVHFLPPVREVCLWLFFFLSLWPLGSTSFLNCRAEKV